MHDLRYYIAKETINCFSLYSKLRLHLTIIYTSDYKLYFEANKYQYYLQYKSKYRVSRFRCGLIIHRYCVKSNPRWLDVKVKIHVLKTLQYIFMTRFAFTGEFLIFYCVQIFYKNVFGTCIKNRALSLLLRLETVLRTCFWLLLCRSHRF